MLKLSKIDDKLSIYQNKRIIIYGTGSAAKSIYRRLKYFGLSIFAFCDSSDSKVGEMIDNIKVITVSYAFIEAVKKDVIFQIGSSCEDEISEMLKEKGFTNYILYSEAKVRLSRLRYKKLVNNELIKKAILQKYELNHEYHMLEKIFEILNYEDENFVFLCLPPKTGNFTIENTLRNLKFNFCNLWHKPMIFNKNLIESMKLDKIKFITAVRDPISQNISLLFQYISYYDFFFVESEALWKNGGDVQELFDIWLDSTGYCKDDLRGYKDVFFAKPVDHIGMIQQYWDAFTFYIFDIMNEPFDKEKGYSIIKKDKYEVFIYQVEKLNAISPVLIQWLGLPNESSLVTGNIGNCKWSKNSYKEALNNITFPLEYYKKSYDEKYVKHFYSSQDIIKFKEKWKNHIR